MVLLPQLERKEKKRWECSCSSATVCVTPVRIVVLSPQHTYSCKTHPLFFASSLSVSQPPSPSAENLWCWSDVHFTHNASAYSEVWQLRNHQASGVSSLFLLFVAGAHLLHCTCTHTQTHTLDRECLTEGGESVAPTEVHFHLSGLLHHPSWGEPSTELKE